MIGGTIEGIIAARSGNDFWTGQKLDESIIKPGAIQSEQTGIKEQVPKAQDISGPQRYNLSPDPNGSNVTLYRGTTGSETGPGPLFMTDNPSYAAGYIKNGGRLVKVTLPRETLERMVYNGDLSLIQGLHVTGNDLRTTGKAYLEYMFSPSVKNSIVNLFSPF